MAKITKALTDIFVKNVKPTDKLKTHFDGGGLYIEVKPTGVKTWRMKATLNGKSMLLTLGKYPIVGLKQAREKRTEVLRLIETGKDPREVKKEQQEQERAKREYTFEKIAIDWHQNKLSSWKENTAKDILNRLEKDIFPTLGELPFVLMKLS